MRATGPHHLSQGVPLHLFEQTESE